jgi:hypothetical protein
MLRRFLPAAALVCAVLATPAYAADYDWTAAGDISEARTNLTSAVLADGRVLLIGGARPGAVQDLATVDIYDPRSHTWSAGPPMGQARRFASAVTLRDGRVLVLGGAEDADQRIAELFDPATGTWKRAADSTAPHTGGLGFLLDDGRALFLAGGSYWSDWAGGEIYDPATDSWSPTAKPFEVAGAARPVVRLRDGRFLVVGYTFTWDGVTTIELPRAEIYDPASDTWTRVEAPQYGHEGALAALLPDGRALLAGGRPLAGPDRLLPATAHAKSELFDPATGTWTPTGDLTRPRASGSLSAALPDGSVAATGGSWATIVGPYGQRRFGEIFYETTAEVYEPAAGAWRAIPEAVYARSSGVAVALADGSMLAAAGVANGGFPITQTERLVPRPAPPATQPPPVVVPPPAQPAPPKAGTLRLVKPAKALKPSRTGTLTLKVRCAKGGAACADRLILRARGRVLAQRDVSVPAGKTATVRLKLRPAARRALRHRTTRVSVTLRRDGAKLSVTVRG